MGPMAVPADPRRILWPTVSAFAGPSVVRVAVVATLLAGASLAGCGSDERGTGADGTTGADVTEDSPGAYSGYTVDPPSDVSAIALPAADGSGVLAMPADPGGLRIVYFGYTSCPDVCPTTMSDLRRTLAALPEDEQARVEVAMVTIDPARDGGQLLVDYVTAFIPAAVAVRTEDDSQLRAATSAFGADYEVTTDAEGEVEVSHTGELYAVDDAGLVVMQWPFGTGHDSLTRDLRSLLADSGHPQAATSESATP